MTSKMYSRTQQESDKERIAAPARLRMTLAYVLLALIGRLSALIGELGVMHETSTKTDPRDKQI